MVDNRWRAMALAGLLSALIGAGCSGAQTSSRTTGGETGGETAGDVATEDAAEPGDEGTYLDQPACQALDDTEMDPLQRWIRAFPIEQGGAVLVFGGATAAQMDVEAALEMAAIVGYEDFSCGTSVVVWVPGMECQGEETGLAHRIEEGSSMTHLETTCFRIDEVRLRLREECERGTVPADRCP